MCTDGLLDTEDLLESGSGLTLNSPRQLKPGAAADTIAPLGELLLYTEVIPTNYLWPTQTQKTQLVTAGLKRNKTCRFEPTELMELLGLKQIQVKSTIRLISLMSMVQASMA